MTLLELLRQELPKRGGWPEGVAAMAQDADGAVQNYVDTRDIKINYEFAHGTSRIARSYSIDPRECEVSTDRLTAIVTREQYGANGWDGTGLPPVGAECESKQSAQIDWHKFRVVAVENGHIFGFWHDEVGACLDSTRWIFRPLRTEAERAIDEMVRLSGVSTGVSTGAAKILYDAGYRK